MTTYKRRLQFGEFSIPVNSLSSTGLLNGTNLPTSRPAAPPLQTRRWARNGKHPNAIAESLKSEAGNQAALFKTKQVFRSLGMFPSPLTSHGMTAGSGVCNRWRCAFHSGPYANFLDVEVHATTDGAFGTANAYAQVDITDVAAGTTQTATFPTGPVASNTSYFDNFQLLTQRIFVTPDRDYTVVFSEHGSSTSYAGIAEFSSLTAYMGGYLPQNIAVNGPIVAGYRKNLAELVRKLWQRGGRPLANWSIEDGTLPVTTTSATPTNVIDAYVDGAVTTTLGSSVVTPNTPGWIIDTTGQARRSQTAPGSGIPIVLAVYGSSIASGSGFVQLVDPTGTIVALGEELWTGTPGWAFVSGWVMPVNKLQKYDLQFWTNATSATIHAASLYMLE